VRIALIAAGGVLLLLVFSVCGGLAAVVVLFGGGGPPGLQVRASGLASSDIPAAALADYQAAAQTCPGLSWTVLAGIGKVESDHGRSNLTGVHSESNSAGAMGPMQFLPGTWSTYNVPGMDDVYDLRDAAFAAARYLCANGAGAAERLRQAVFAYNHLWSYVDEVLGWAARYAADQTVSLVSGLAQAGDPFGGACRPVVTQPFGPTTLAGEPSVFGYAHFHTGIDLACASGTPIHSLTDGVAHVTQGWTPSNNVVGGFGNSVVVEVETELPGDASPQRYFIRYAHLETVTVADGATVHAGDLVGLEGATGYATGPHLHFEVDRGAALVQDAVNPAPLLRVG
jgi:murein DD-endopeptidase MepM/ murein hydrolase activator NlpD